MQYSFETQNTCAKVITFDLNGEVVTNIQFHGGGCPGNLQAVPKLAEGLTVSEIVEKVGGITCGFRGTSCADQLAKAVAEAYEKSKQTAS